MGSDFVKARSAVTAEEAIWLIEKAAISRDVYQDIRLRFLDRYEIGIYISILNNSFYIQYIKRDWL